jgi:hypothetical protein
MVKTEVFKYRKFEDAKAMLREKLPVDLIIRVTNLTREQIETIA